MKASPAAGPGATIQESRPQGRKRVLVKALGGDPPGAIASWRRGKNLWSRCRKSRHFEVKGTRLLKVQQGWGCRSENAPKYSTEIERACPGGTRAYVPTYMLVSERAIRGRGPSRGPYLRPRRCCGCELEKSQR